MAKRRFVFLLCFQAFLIFCITYYANVISNIPKNDYKLETSSYNKKLILKSKCSCRPEVIEVETTNDYYFIKQKKDKSYLNTLRLDRQAFKLENITCDLYNVLRRGPKQKVIGFSLYGRNELYYKQIKYNVKLISKYYPGWLVRIYYDETVDHSVKCEIECLKNEETNIYYDIVDFCFINEIPFGLNNKTWNASYAHAMKWRWFPIADPFVDLFMSRDTDSWVIQREVDSVNIWLKSNKLFHVMRDHPKHRVPILGGLWGFKNFLNRDLGNSIFTLMTDKNIATQYNAGVKNRKQGDQDFLKDHIWKIAKLNATVHASFHCDSFDYIAEAFPNQRSELFCFVSCRNCCDERFKNKTFKWECPEKCRPAEHKDWLKC